MILTHKSLKRSGEIMRSFRSFCECNFQAIDGIVEVFNNNIGQGYLIKIFQSYNRANDLVVWIFESLLDKNIQVAYSTHANIDEHNNWLDKTKVNFKIYPIKTNIKRQIVTDLHSTINSYYGFDEKIEMPKDINI